MPYSFNPFTGTFDYYETGGGGGTSPLTTKGDLYGFSTLGARIPVGNNGQVLLADSTVPLGVKWSNYGSIDGGSFNDTYINTADIDGGSF